MPSRLGRLPCTLCHLARELFSVASALGKPLSLQNASYFFEKCGPHVINHVLPQERPLVAQAWDAAQFGNDVRFLGVCRWRCANGRGPDEGEYRVFAKGATFLTRLGEVGVKEEVKRQWLSAAEENDHLVSFQFMSNASF